MIQVKVKNIYPLKIQKLTEIKFTQLANFFEKQKIAASLVKDYKYILYGGAAGGGKSRWLRWMAVARLLEFYMRGLNNVRVGLFCESYTALNDRHLSKIEFEFPEWLGKWNGERKEFKFTQDLGSHVIAFRNLDDLGKYLSAEFADIYVDELTMSARDVFDFLVGTRMRWPFIPDSKFLAASNPGQIGHGWVKKLWIDRDFSNEKLKEEEFVFCKALWSDNPHLPPSYGDQLDRLPEHLRRAYSPCP